MKTIEDQIVEMRKKGASYNQIKRALGLKESVVANILKKRGMTNNQEVNKIIQERKNQETQKRDKAIIEMKNSGAAYDEIMRKLDISISVVQQVLKDNGLTKSKETIEQRNTKIIAMIKAGVPYKQIREDFYITNFTIEKILKENGLMSNEEIKNAKKEERKQKYEQRDKEIVAMRKQGATYKQIKEKFNISEPIIARILKENGLTNNEEIKNVKKEERKQKYEQRDKEIVAMRKQGATYEQIKEKFNITTYAVGKILEENGLINNEEIKNAKKEERKQKYEQRDKEIVEMRKQGATYKQIEEKLNISEQIIARVLKENGLIESEEIKQAKKEQKEKEKQAKKEQKEKRDKQIVEMRKQGATYKQIKEKISISETIIARVLKENGLISNEEIKNAKKEERKKKDEQRDKEIVAMRKQGATYKQIKEKFSISEPIIGRILKENGLINNEEINDIQKQVRKKQEEQRDKEIVAMRKQGATYKQIEEKLNISEQIIARVLKENGLISSKEQIQEGKVNKQKEKEQNKRKKQEEKEKRNTKIVDIRKNGKLYRKIAEELDVSIRQIERVLKEQNMISSREQVQERKEQEEKEKQERKEQEEQRDKQIVVMRKAGLTYQQIAEELDTSASTVRKVLQEQGITNNNEIREAKKMKKEEVEKVSGFNTIVAESQKTSGTKTKKYTKDYSQSEISSIIRKIYDEKKKVDIKQLNMLVDLNYDRVKFEDIQLVVRICTRQGEISQAIRIVNTLIYTQESIHIDKEKLKELLNALKNHQKKIMIIRKLKANQSTSKIASEMGIPEVQIIKIKRQWEENKAKKMGSPSSESPNIGVGIGEE